MRNYDVFVPGEKESHIETLWMHKQVTRTKPDGHVGPHTVIECFWDENGALHCKDDQGYWTPASMLELIDG